MKNIKLKEILRNKLVSFIKLDDIYEHVLSEINRLEKDIKHQDKRNDGISVSIKQTNNSIRNIRNDVDILQNTIRNVVSVGADIVPYPQSEDRSWAVVCIEGNYNIVKFIDLNGADYRQILNYLKQFEGSRMVIDAPAFTYFEKEFKMK